MEHSQPENRVSNTLGVAPGVLTKGGARTSVRCDRGKYRSPWMNRHPRWFGHFIPLALFVVTLGAVPSYVLGQTPGAPTDLEVEATSTTQISLSWTAPADDGNGAIEAYNVYRCDEPCTLVQADHWIAWVDDGTTFTDTHDDSTGHESGGTSPISAGSRYRYAVAAYRGGGGGWSNEVTVVAAEGGEVIIEPARDRIRPTDLEVTGTSATQISLSWTAPSDDGNGAIEAYNVYRCDEPCALRQADDWIAWVADGTAFTDTHDDSTGHEEGGTSPIIAGSRYRYAVAAYRGGEGDWSNEVTAVAAEGGVADNTAPAFAEGASIGDLVFTAGEAVEPLTLPMASGGDIDAALNGGELSDYSLDPAELPEGLAFDRFTRVLSGTPAAALERADFTYWVHDDDDDYSAEDADSLAFTITVEAGGAADNTAPAFAEGASIGDLVFTAGEAVEPLTLPMASGGVIDAALNGGELSDYSLDPAELPEGLAFDRFTRVLSGTPAAALERADFTYWVHDDDDDYSAEDADSLAFTITVEAGGAADNTAPAFAEGASIGDLVFTAGEAVEPLTLPMASGGDIDAALNGGELSDYSLDPAELPEGLAFDRFTRVLSGTPAVALERADFTYWVHDDDDDYSTEDADSLAFTITVEAGGAADNTAPAFAEGASIGDLVFTAGEAVEPLTLPMASGGDIDAALNGGELSDYSLDPAELPEGLAFDRFTRVLSGTPAVALERADFTYWVHDDDDDYSTEDADSLAFTITVEAGGAADNTAPAFAEGASIGDLVFTAGEAVEPLTLPMASGGDIDAALNGGELSDYSLDPAELPEGLAFDRFTRVLSGTPAAALERADFTYWVHDDDDDYSAEDADSLAFTITVEAGGVADNTAPRFAEGASIGDLVFTAGEAVEPLTLPMASGGDIDAALNGGELSDYSLDPTELPEGLAFDRFTRVLSGTPAAALERADYTYWVHDDDDDYSAEDADSLAFTITVEAGGAADNTAPAFAEGASIGDLVFTAGEAVEPLTLPMASGGDIDAALNGGELSDYSLDPAELPEELAFDRFTRVLSGTPAAALERADFTYWVHDDDDDYSTEDADSLAFTITVEAASGPPQAESKRLAPTVQKALAGFGRAIAGDAVDLVQSRIGRSSLVSNSSHLALAGHQFGFRGPPSSPRGRSEPWHGNPDHASEAWRMNSLNQTLHTPNPLGATNNSTQNEFLYPRVRGTPVARGQRNSFIELATGSSFEYALDGGDGTAADSGWSLWGRGSLNEFDSGSQQELSVNGRTWAGYLGLDYRFGAHGLLGGALSKSSGTVEYQDSEAGQGELELSLLTGYQYGAWAPSADLSLWGMFGIGRGDLELSDEQAEYDGTDLAFHMGAFGVRRNVASLGEVDWAAKADAFLSRLASDNLPDLVSGSQTPLLPSIKASTWRLRLLMEASRSFQLSEQTLVMPSFEFGVLREGGDFEEEYFGELGGDLRISHTGLGLEVEASFSTQASGEDRKFDDWSASLTVSIDPGHDGTGLALALSPVWGDGMNGVSQIWQGQRGLGPAFHGRSDRQEASLHREERVDLRMSYGFPVSRGLVTPFAQFSTANDVLQRFRLGAQLDLGLRGVESLPGRLQLELAYEARTEKGVFLTLRHRFSD